MENGWEGILRDEVKEVFVRKINWKKVSDIARQYWSSS
jgi:hypothetical protein